MVNMGLCLASYEVATGVERALTTTRAIAQLHRRHEAPATFFVVTRLLELAGDELRKLLDDPLFEVQSSTHYCSGLLPCADTPGLSPEDGRRELERSLRTLRRFFPNDVLGLLVPFGSAQGLAGQGEVLHILHDLGLQYVRSATETGTHGNACELSSPYWYEDDGFPGILEIPRRGRGSGDTLHIAPGAAAAEDAAALGPPDVEALAQQWRKAVESAVSQGRAIEVPWGHLAELVPPARAARELGAMLRHATEAGLRITSCRELYRERARSRGDNLLPADTVPLTAAPSPRLESLLCDANHELRSALNPISGYAEMLAAELAGPVNTRQRQWVGEIQRAADHMLYLLEAVVDLTRLDAGRLELDLQPLPVRQLADDALRRARELAAPDSLTARADISPDATTVYGDERWLARALDCLLANGVIYSPGDVQIEITARRYGKWVAIEVTDHGIGIAPENQPRIFERRAQFPGPPSRPAPGLGLGLPLARGIVELHGGTLVLRRSSPGQGSTFRLRLLAGTPPADVEQ